MIIGDTLGVLVQRLRAARDFDEGSGELLGTLRELLSAGLGPRGALIARGSVHLRSEQRGYRALAVREWTDDPPPRIEPSATIFGLLESRDAGAILDLGTGNGIALRDGAPVKVPVAKVAHDAAESVQEMIAREATHIIALPLSSGGVLSGMVCIELAWPAQLALPIEHEPLFSDLDSIVELTSARVSLLPLPSSEPPASTDPLFPVLGERTRPLFRVLEVFASQDETLLITGPTGAGKSRLAQWCHARSRRTEGPFETANLLAVPETMQMAELFGWKKGAFTGAVGDRDGLVAKADGGTLFLDEIDKLTLAAQAGLLRLLETRRFTPLGAAREQSADVRFVVATNADLRALVRKGQFREDLYYRINVLPVRLEPLSERMDEVHGWADVLLARRHGESGGSGEARFTEDAVAQLVSYRWPGNLRQLDNVVRRAYALWIAKHGEKSAPLVDGESTRAALALEAAQDAMQGAQPLRLVLRSLAKLLVDHALEARREGIGVELGSLDVVRGAVLREAVDRLGSVKDAYLLFGADALVSTRNHSAAYRRELEKLEDLEARLDGGE